MTGRLNLASSRMLETDLPAFIMGVLNATPDSFWDQSRTGSLASGVERALAMEADGADIIDIGGESTRPGSAYVGAEEEIARVIPLILEIRKHSRIPISVDTRKASVLKAALEAGADICNDVSSLEDDADMASLAADAGIPVILMHKRGIPATMQDSPSYADVVSNVADYLFSRARYAEECGIARDKIILDPGIGFGKSYAHNCALLSGLSVLSRGAYPVLVGLSRKSCIGQMTGRETSLRLSGTLAANLIAVQNGAGFLRVHDVAETRDILSVLQEITGSGIH